MDPFRGLATFDTVGRPSNSPTGSIFARRRRERRALIFSPLHPAYLSLRDKSNVLTADEALCQEQKDLVKEYDAKIKRYFDPRKPHEDIRTMIIRNKRAQAMEKIRDSKRGRSQLIVELAQAQQSWEMINKPSQEELEELSDRLEQEFQLYWKALQIEKALAVNGPASPDSTEYHDLGKLLAGLAAPSSAEDEIEKDIAKAMEEENLNPTEPSASSSSAKGKSKAPSVRSMDLTNLWPFDYDYAAAAVAAADAAAAAEAEDRAKSVATTVPLPSPTRSESADSNSSEVTVTPTTPLESLFERFNETMQASRDSVSSVLRSIGNLRQRRRKSD